MLLKGTTRCGPKDVLMSDSDSVPDAVFVAGRLSLDFMNTRCQRLGQPIDLLGDTQELMDWLRVAESVYDRQFVAQDILGDKRALKKALSLRGGVAELIESVLAHRPPAAASVESVNRVLSTHPARPQLGYADAEWYWETSVGNTPDRWLWEVAVDAADLLCEGDHSLLKRCDGDGCGRVFYDITKNHGRRWCADRCGNRVKAAAYYHRKRARET